MRIDISASTELHLQASLSPSDEYTTHLTKLRTRHSRTCVIHGDRLWSTINSILIFSPPWNHLLQNKLACKLHTPFTTKKLSEAFHRERCTAVLRNMKMEELDASHKFLYGTELNKWLQYRPVMPDEEGKKRSEFLLNDQSEYHRTVVSRWEKRVICSALFYVLIYSMAYLQPFMLMIIVVGLHTPVVEHTWTLDINWYKEDMTSELGYPLTLLTLL